MGKKVFLLCLVLFGISTYAFAGTTDSLGLKSTWDIVGSWFEDGYASKLIAAGLFCVGLWRAYAGSILQFFLMLGFAILAMNGKNIIETLGSGLF
ncbi:hypothetical protein [Campylobacter insulaenigrae]|uniref:hypothetical protein n=1 Tax=Campylobacter insulaenigrae TaxID=260714 RepID=UPI0021536C07|nr:hypothetical protein [Campylobacter insulaenigrae]MCR6574451.1 hypothetical protein [Campylobacter insulaenigrae]